MKYSLRYQRARLVATLMLCLTSTDLLAQEPQDQPLDLAPLTAEAAEAAEKLAAEYPPDSEAGVMLATILSGRGMSGGTGWYKLAVPQSRFDWTYLSATYDINQDGAIVPDEFPGAVAAFRSLDHDQDRQLTPTDMAWESDRGSNEYKRLSNQIDRDGDGRLTNQEFNQWASRVTGDQDSLSLEEFRALVSPPESASGRGKERPNRSTLIMGLARQEIGSLQPGPSLGESVPDFELTTVDGKPVRLLDHLGERPLVLVFGNYTCSPFRAQAGNLERLYTQYKDQAEFLMVYVREAHPEDGWASSNNERLGVQVFQPQDFEQRLAVAKTCSSHLGFDIPVLVDDLQDSVGRQYSGGPARLYLIDREGKVAFKGGRGPFHFMPSQLESALVWMLAEESANQDLTR